MSGTAGGGADPAELALGQLYIQALRFALERAAAGDRIAQGFAAGSRGFAHMPPTRGNVMTWLAGVAAERRMIRPVADPAIATRLIALIQVEERRVPAAAERVWTEVVAAARGGSLVL